MARASRHFACSFCGKSQDQVRRLIAGPNGVYICDECVSLCNEIIAEGTHEAPSQRAEGTLSTGRQRATPRWRRLMRRWLETQRDERLRMAARELMAGARPSRT